MGRSATAPALALLAALALGCGEDVPLGTIPGSGDAGPRPDGGADAGFDAGHDAGAPDAGFDAGPPRPIGAGCEDASQCAGPDAVCLRAVVELVAGVIRVDFSNGGYCTRRCDDASLTCPAGSACTPDSVVDRWCVDLCSTDADCRVAEGYGCQDVDGMNVCVPPLL